MLLMHEVHCDRCHQCRVGTNGRAVCPNLRHTPDVHRLCRIALTKSTARPATAQRESPRSVASQASKAASGRRSFGTPPWRSSESGSCFHLRLASRVPSWALCGIVAVIRGISSCERYADTSAWCTSSQSSKSRWPSCRRPRRATPSRRLPRMTPNTIVRHEARARELDETRRRGYAIDEEENRARSDASLQQQTPPCVCEGAASIGSSPLAALDHNVQTHRADDDRALDDAFQICRRTQQHEPI